MADATWIGWDIGGAHLKAAAVDGAGRVVAAVQRPCALWRGLDQLEGALDEAKAALPPAAWTRARHAATMTGEMVDLFDDRATGVQAIAALLQRRLPGSPMLFSGDRGFVGVDEAAACAAALASANWLATAQWVARRAGDALLVDIGSTTTDLVPLRGGRIASDCRGDFERLVASELVYCGIARTPLMALAEAVPFEGLRVPLMAEYFATTADVYRLTGELDERADQHPAADSGAKTPLASARRLARMIGCDAPEAGLPRWIGLAQAFREAQLARMEAAARRVLDRAGLADAAPAVAPAGAPVAAPAPLVAAGSGAFLARALAQRLARPCRHVADVFDAPGVDRELLSACAPAAAVALLAR